MSRGGQARRLEGFAFVGPFLLGWIKDLTGSYALGMLPMIGLAVAGGVVVLAMSRTTSEALVPATE